MNEMNQNASIRNFCSNCGAKLEGSARFCGVCGAPQEVVSQAAPAPEQPIPERAPVVTPAAAAETVTRNRFPVAPLILSAIATIYYLINLLSDNYLAIDPFRNILYFLPYTMMIFGLCLSKGNRNVLFGVSFLLMGGVELLFWLYDVFGNGYYNSPSLVADILFYLPMLIFTALIGIPYLTGSSKGTKNALAIWVIILTIHVLAFNYIYYYDFYHYYPSATTDLILDLLLRSVPTMLAVLTYTPFREKQ